MKGDNYLSKRYDLDAVRGLQEKAHQWANAEIERKGFLFRPHDDIEAMREYDDIYESLVASYKQKYGVSYEASPLFKGKPRFGVPIQYLKDDEL